MRRQGAQIYLIEGRTEKQKRAPIEKVAQALVEVVGAPQEIVRVWIHHVRKKNWGSAGRTAKSLER
ncbi:tautomerase family protein [Variovorax robiniae]|uniref:Tautomerase family protein n=1 Tax=Variovorax robiniae TaxID=1836199 RepID=A0ABU8XH24_9BURK